MRTIIIPVIFLLFAANVFAGDLASKEACSYYDEAVKLQESGNFQGAQVLYQKTLLLSPNNLEWEKRIHNNYGVIAAQEGSFAEAEEFFNKSLAIDKDYAPAKLNLGFIYEQRRSELESIKYWLKVLNINLDEVKPKEFVLGKGIEPEKK